MNPPKPKKYKSMMDQRMKNVRKRVKYQALIKPMSQAEERRAIEEAIKAGKLKRVKMGVSGDDNIGMF